MSVNQATLIGEVGTDFRVNHTHKGDKVANFTLTTTKRWNDKVTGENKKVTQYHPITVFNQYFVNLAENHLEAGSKVAVIGEIQYKSSVDENGSKNTKAEIVIQGFGSTLEIMSPGKQSNVAAYA